MIKIGLPSTAGLALLLALAAATLSGGFWALAPRVSTTLEWAPYDLWLHLRRPEPSHPALVLIRRDADTDQRFGGGPLDRAVFARLVTALTRAGAEVIGLDMILDRSTPPFRGGLASDAILLDATRISGRVAYPLAVTTGELDQATAPSGVLHPNWPTLSHAQRGHLRPATHSADPWPTLARYALAIGHNLDPADDDGVFRRVPLFVRLGDRGVPAFGLALAAAFLDVTGEHLGLHRDTITLRNARPPGGEPRTLSIPLNARGEMLISPLHGEVPSHSLLEVWEAVGRGDFGSLEEWVSGKLVLILPGERATASQDADPSLIHAAVVDTILSRHWVTESSRGLSAVITIALGTLGAWLLLAHRTSGGTGVVVLAGVAYLCLVFWALWATDRVLPVVGPLTTLALAAGAGNLWMQRRIGRQMGRLEEEIRTVQQELAGARQQLIARESVVEGLEEDLEEARAAAAKSAGQEQALAQTVETLRRQMTQATLQEQTTRELLRKLTDELHGLQAATTAAQRADTPELEPLARECEQMGILTEDPRMLSVYHDLKKGARTSLPILLLGEPGTGKELFAQAAHRLSSRVTQPFVAVNMAAISPELFEAELFGHTKGSFTGALAERKGYFEGAHGGTLFLDEIGDLRLDHQGKLLRVLQEHTFYRVGASQPTSSDVRIIAATNKELDRGVVEGWFREDLYFRLKGVVLRLPPLRERPDDVGLLAERFATRAARQLGKEIHLSREAVTALHAHPWRGNVRELQQCVTQAVALAEGPTVTQADLRLAEPMAAASGPGRASPGLELDVTGDRSVLACLREHEFDMQETARALGWDRSTVTQRLKGLGFRALVEARGDYARAAQSLAGATSSVGTVELKLREYHAHLIKTIQGFSSAEEAMAACRKRFKNLPDRHFTSVESLVRHYFRAEHADPESVS